MANSKSNIYPIQLQGAELNLNKFDAEIKQYSGFNKNNAPFVGGCLSNLFTKDESIISANGDNVFIAPNGDIYEAKTDGLYKNDEILFRYDNNTFFDVEEIPIESNVVRVFGENLKLCRTHGTWTYVDERYSLQETMTGTKYILKIGDQELSDDNIMMFFRDANIGEVFTEEQLDEAVWNCTNCIYVTQGDKQYAVLFGVMRVDAGGYKLINTRHIVIDVDTLEIVENVVHYGANGLNAYETSRPVAICYVNYNGVHYMSFYYYFINTSMNKSLMTSFIGTFENGIFTQEEHITGTEYRGMASNNVLLTTDFNDYSVVGYPYNVLFIKNIPASDITSETNIKAVYAIGDPVVIDNKLNYSRRGAFTAGAVRHIYGKSSKDLNQEENLSKGIITQLVRAYDYQIAYETYNTSPIVTRTLCTNTCTSVEVGYSFYDSETLNSSPETFSKSEYRLGLQQALGDKFLLLLNNNQLSGIAGKNVLLSNWNTVEAASLIFYSRGSEARVYYKEGQRWFVIKTTTTPKLSLKGNQLVVNVDAVRNSYDISRNKILFFAPNYNGCIFVAVDTGISYSFSGITNDIYVAGAVNEYEQENNSSIILNPIAWAGEGYVHKVLVRDYDYRTQLKYPVNIYVNYPEASKITYVYTYNLAQNYGLTQIPELNVHKNVDLMGLPFPSDTNGNVEYSPSLFADIKSVYGNQAFIKNGNTFYPLVIGGDSLPIMSFYMASGIDNFEEGFVIQGQFYGIMNNCIYNVAYINGVVAGVSFVVSVEGLQFCGNTPYEALFYSKTNRCLYAFTGANVLNSKQFVDKLSVVKGYKYNPATQSIFLLTDIGVIVSSLFGIYLIDMPEAESMFILDNGVVLTDNAGNYRYVRYYKEDAEDDFLKENIKLETCFYGMNNETVTINDCLYIRLFSEEHEEGDLEVSATTLSLKGRMTEKTTFKIKASDWDAITHTIYLRYQPKEQRGLGISFSINSPFKIASLSIGSQADAILVDKVSKSAINAPQRTSNNDEW